MSKLVIIAFLPFLFFFGDTSDADKAKSGTRDLGTGTLRKMLPESGSVTLQYDLGRLRGRGRGEQVELGIGNQGFLPVMVFNNELRSPLPGTLPLTGDSRLPRGARVKSDGRLMLETTQWGSDREMILRDGQTAMPMFEIDGIQQEFDPVENAWRFQNARLLLTKDYAAELGNPDLAGAVVGTISLTSTMRVIEITNMVDGDVQGDVLPASTENGSVPGPDVIVGDLNGLSQPESGIVNGLVGVSVGTDSCNLGTIDLNWFQLPNNDHPVIPQNLYRMSGGPNNDLRFEQIGQSNVKHAFTALRENICSLGCNNVGGTHLGSGCSDPYVVSLNSGGTAHNLGSRAWINPFTGNFPASSTVNTHSGHTHTVTSHRMLVPADDLNTNLNPGASYYSEAQYITPHEYAWCQANPGQCNMYNNVSYRRYVVSGTTGPQYSFNPSTYTTQREKAAIQAWTGATLMKIEPAPGVDGVGTFGYKVTNPSAGVWHYEYAIYNQNMDRGIQSFGLPMGAPVSLANVDFHAPTQQPGWANDNTANNAGFSSTPWSSIKNAGDFVWSTETFAQNQNANAIRWGTLYNFRFDANYAPQMRTVTIGFFKTGAPMTIQVPVPTAMVALSGRILGDGRGVAGARVTITDGSGFSQAVFTDKIGNYQFSGVPSGGSYTLTVVQRRWNFAPQSVPVNDTTSGVNFIGTH